MSVKTTADKRIESIKDGLDGAIKELSTIIIDKGWGWENWCTEYQNILVDTLHVLMKLRNDI